MEESMNIIRILPALLSLILLVSSGCADYDAEFKRVDDRIDEIENNRIPSIDKQLEKINASLPELERTDLEIKKMIAKSMKEFAAALLASEEE
jgi:vacuolar-type H+-ATPase subunit D/Vma8